MTSDKKTARAKGSRGRKGEIDLRARSMVSTRAPAERAPSARAVEASEQERSPRTPRTPASEPKKKKKKQLVPTTPKGFGSSTPRFEQPKAAKPPRNAARDVSDDESVVSPSYFIIKEKKKSGRPVASGDVFTEQQRLLVVMLANLYSRGKTTVPWKVIATAFVARGQHARDGALFTSYQLRLKFKFIAKSANAHEIRVQAMQQLAREERAQRTLARAVRAKLARRPKVVRVANGGMQAPCGKRRSRCRRRGCCKIAGRATCSTSTGSTSSASPPRSPWALERQSSPTWRR